MQASGKAILSPTIKSLIWLSHQSRRAQNGAAQSERRQTPGHSPERSYQTMERREFFKSLIAGGAIPRKNRKHVQHTDAVLYRGPMTIPAHVYEAVREDPCLCHATGRPGHGRKGHLVSRYAEADATVYLFRCQIPASRQMVGEVVRTELGRLRVHCWTAASPGNYDEPLAIVERKAQRDTVTREPLLPPLATPEREWDSVAGLMEYTE